MYIIKYMSMIIVIHVYIFNYSDFTTITITAIAQ